MNILLRSILYYLKRKNNTKGENIVFLLGVSIYETFEEKVSITLDEDIIEQVKLLAEENDRSFSQYVNLVLRSYLRQREAREKTKD